MENISGVAKVEKNKLNTDSVFLIALEITIPDVNDPIRIINNNEDVTWAGVLYQAFNFEISEIKETTTGEVSEFNLRVNNTNNIIGTYLRVYDAYVKLNGFEPITVKLSVVNSNNLTSATPEIQHITTLIKPTLSYEMVTFTLGGVNSYNKIINSFMFKNNCRWKFKDLKCGYSGGETVCNKTLARCKELSNQLRYGGFPLIGNTGVTV